MKVNFNGKDSHDKSQIVKGSYEDMLRFRKENMPDFEKTINGMLEDYDGELIAIIRIHEDENGNPSSGSATITGVTGTASTMRMHSELRGLAKTIQDEVIEDAKENPDLASELLKHVLSQVLNEKKEK